MVRDSLAKAYKLTTKHFDNHVSCIELKTHSGTYRFASVYLRPSIVDPELSLNTILDNLFTHSSVFCLDANARNLLWNSSCTDHKGYNFESIFQSRKLNIVNVPKADLDFVPRGTSFVDITVAGDRVNVTRWIFLELHSLSDHPYIYFEVPLSPPTPLSSSKARNSVLGRKSIPGCTRFRIEA